MVYNYCFNEFRKNKLVDTRLVFNLAGASVNFEDMTETIGSEVRQIRRVDDRYFRVRQKGSERSKAAQ